MKAVLDFDEYIDLVEKLAQSDAEVLAHYTNTPAEYLHSNAVHFHKTLSSVHLNKKVYNYLSELKKRLKWTLITEPWCGDAAFSTPYIIMMANSAEHIDLKIALRDKNDVLMNQYLTNGGKSIPILVCTDEKGKFLFKWGPRPKLCQTFVDTIPKEIALKSKIEKILDWYVKNDGEQVQLEIFELLKTIK